MLLQRGNRYLHGLFLGALLPAGALHAELQSQAGVVGSESQWWNNYTVTLTNTGTNSVDLRGASIAFNSAIATPSPEWSGTGISYPSLTASSQASSGQFANVVSVNFENNSWTDSTLEPGNSVVLTYGISGQIDLNLVNSSLVVTTAGGVDEPTLSVSLTSPLANAEYQLNDVVQLEATPVIQHASLEKVDFYVDSQLIATDTSSPYQAQWTATSTGSHNVEAIAVGSDNLSANDNAVITVTDTPPDASIDLTLTSPGANASFQAGENVTISASVDVLNTNVARVEFSVDNVIIATDNSAPFEASWQAAGEGTRSISASAFSTTDNLTSTQSVSVNVNPVITPEAPQVSLSAPGNLFVNRAVTLTANVTDGNDDVESVTFYVDGQPIGTDTTAPYQITYTATQVGNVLLSASAIDATNLTGQSSDVIASVSETGSGNLSCDIAQIYREDGSECMGDDHPRRIIGYFTSWRTGKNGLPSYLAKDLPWDKLTHINYAFASINTQTNEIQVSAEATDLEWPEVPGAEMDPAFNYKGHFNHISSLKQQYPDVKTLISVGGWAETTGFYAMTTNLNTCGVNIAGINAFNASAVEFIRQYGFDGVDVDYEYPSSMKDSGNPIDFAISNKCRGQLMSNYKVFMQALRAELDAAGAADNRKYMLTIAAPSSGYLLRGMEDFALGDELDYVNIMTYDLHGAWNEFVGPQAALFDNGDDAELAAANVYGISQFQQIGYLNTAWAYQYFRGVFSPAQINIGIPYYTRGFQGVSGGTNGLWGRAALPNQTQCQPGTGLTTPCGYGAEGIDNLWHDLDENGNEVPAGSMPMWHAMNLKDADTLNFGDMPSYGPDWGLDPANPADKITGDYQYHYSEALGASWLWNPTKSVFLSIEDEVSLAQKLEFIIEMGAGGMMVWEMAGDYQFDSAKGEYTFGTTLTDLAYNTFANASPMVQTHHSLAAPDETVDLALSTREWPEGDNNYPVNPTLVIKNNGDVDIPAGTEIQFLVTTSTGDVISDWDGAGTTVVESGYTGNNFKLNGTRKDFHTVSIKLSATAGIPVGGEHTVAMVYYLPVSGIASGVRLLVGDKTLGLKSEFPDLPAFEGATGGGSNGNGGGSSACADQNLDPASFPAYPNFPQQDAQGNSSHAAQGDRITHQNTLWQANWWTNAAPGTNTDWTAVCSY